MNQATEPLKSLDQWDDFVASRYQEGKSEEEFRQYSPEKNPGVAEFYRQNHAGQTVDFVLGKRAEYLSFQKGKKSIWEAAEFLNTLVDDSDPDTDLTQIEHLLQTSEAIRRDGHPRWMVMAGFLHDLGKVLCLYGEPQWAVVGDTFPVGCAWSDKIVYHEYFAANPDARPRVSDRVRHLRAGLRARQGPHVVGSRRIYLPGHQELHAGTGAVYAALSLVLSRPPGRRVSPPDELARRAMFEWVRKFNPYDLYSKGGNGRISRRSGRITRTWSPSSSPPRSTGSFGRNAACFRRLDI